MDLVRKYSLTGALFDAPGGGGGAGGGAAGVEKPAGGETIAGGAAPAGGEKPAAGAGEKPGDGAGGEKPGAGAADPAAAAAAAAAAAGGEKPGAGGEKPAAGGDADWRARLAAGDEAFQKTLGRYSDEAAFGKAHRALLARMSSGELKRALPDNATADEVKAWRTENGLPEKAEDYVAKLALPEGLVLGEADKPIAASFAEVAHKKNWTPAQYSDAVSWYYANLEAQQAAQGEADTNYKRENEDTLRAAWPGQDFRQNLVAVENLIAGWPQGLAASILTARTPDGRKVGDNALFVQQLATLARELNPASTLIPSGSSDPAKGVDDRLAEIRKLRTESPDKYEADKKLQAEELQLIDAQLKLKKRSAA